MTIQDKFKLDGRVALVTGGAGLLGREFCKTLAEAGAKIAVLDLNAASRSAAGTADSLTQSGFNSLALSADITQPDSVNAAVDNVLSTFGRLDILVNSAALDPKFDADAMKKGVTPGAFGDYPLADWTAAL
ncbi:MAG TPA: SDR family NAD(P)-dependent oxidoreductase, partial [Anaerolineales bacterium]|nr:SDR family NAD(P)-dependent oxidoreductase [Anaerolineales bacterium]